MAATASGKADLQRDRILHAAQCCFIEHGFHAASMASIAATAEMSAGLIYRYFASKNEIIVAIIDRQLALQRRSRDRVGRYVRADRDLPPARPQPRAAARDVCAGDA